MFNTSNILYRIVKNNKFCILKVISICKICYFLTNVFYDLLHFRYRKQILTDIVFNLLSWIVAS